MRRFSHDVTPGGLSEADRDRIFALAEKGWGAWRIARRISKNPSTVQGFMSLRGLRPLRRRTGPTSYRLGGRVVHRFTCDQDRFIEELRSAGAGLTAIAAAATARFGITRTSRAIYVRLTVLAAQDEGRLT